MRTNGSSGALGVSAAQTSGALSYVTWQTEEAIALPGAAVRASGDASPQVRSPQRLVAVGNLDAQISHIRQVIVDALAGALVGLEPTAGDLLTRRDEIASLTLVAANRKLSVVGVALLDLRITALESVDA